MAEQRKAEASAGAVDLTSRRADSGIEARVPAERQLARGTIFVGFKQSVLQLWGEPGLRAVAERLPVDVRYDTVDTVLVNSEWLPETHVLAWYEALWSGPCDRQRDRYLAAIDGMMDHGFTRVRKALLTFVSPSIIFSKAPTLWRYDHSHGELSVFPEEKENSVRFFLERHPYTETSLACLAIAEIYRYCVALCRVSNVTASHHRDSDGSLNVRIRWQ